MLFNSFEFLVFFPTVVGLYFLLPHRFRWALLLIASYTFYMFWRVDYAIILVISTLIDYVCGRMMDRYSEEERTKRKPWLWLSLLSNLGILFTFKYYNFFNTAAKDLADVLGVSYAAPAFELLLPMGISFYTFQTMSYSIDVYYGRQKAERHLGIFALFVTFFPQLVAGPIERAGNLLGQLKEKHEFDYDRVTNGLKLIAWGLFKKVVIADRLALMVNQVYNNPTDYEGIPLIIATVFFAFQIYCDFSGYSDIAIGTAQVMGFRLMENFRRPYFSKSIREFWSRWHISLSTWFRDYLYIPLGGNRVVKWRWYYNLFVVFLVSGLWHGANWTFIVWGALHGFYQVFGLLTAKRRDALVERLGLNRNRTFYKALQVITTFALVCLAWVFFRANTISDAWYITTHMFQNLAGSTKEFVTQLAFGGVEHLRWLDRKEFILALLFIGVMEGAHYLQRNRKLRLHITDFNPVLRWGLYSVCLLILIYFGVFSSNEFIYFQF
ncbi:D-alanyl-lipoteichoic acid acyltransferase DltB (MBOAT superfamily) [Pontibacter mucosus]|uniref:D-alanyl-lipoteichoic acid acyltransferase DltB (MBOAT superfamily) n=1 Tax=Pontibacter mucosus TaxID=1649266 RepID=A0A2T5Y3I1_9BACT|nr:MBOAT family O-acyltransferase [Pontibacter mucosus]PTX10677.1 D-alanyl-lipoteichoic acid acyltransferase DltB (MBOAT superfamily) [Pontibacter mucosus]